MSGPSLSYQISQMKKFMCDEGLITKEVFEEMETTVPDRIPTVVHVFFTGTAELIAEMEEYLEERPIIFKKFSFPLFKLKGAALSIGLKKINSVVDTCREQSDNRYIEGFKESFEQLKNTVAESKHTLEAYADLVAQQALKCKL